MNIKQSIIDEMQKFDYNDFYRSRQEKGAVAPKVVVARRKTGRRTLKDVAMENLGIRSGVDLIREVKAEKFLKANGIDVYVVGNVDGIGRTYFLVKKPADKEKFYNGKMAEDPRIYKIMIDAVEMAGGTGAPRFGIGYTQAKKAVYDKKEADRVMGDRANIVIHKKNGRTITIKNNGKRISEQLDEYLASGVITEEEIINTIQIYSESKRQFDY